MCWSLQYCHADTLLCSWYLLICWGWRRLNTDRGSEVGPLPGSCQPDTQNIWTLHLDPDWCQANQNIFSLCITSRMQPNISTQNNIRELLTSRNRICQIGIFHRLSFLYIGKTKVVLDNSNQLAADLEFMIHGSGLNGTMLTSWPGRNTEDLPL